MRVIHGEGGTGKGRSTSTRTPVEGPNTLRSIATARIIDLVSEGPIVGLVDGLKSVYFDNTPLLDSEGNANFANVTVEERLGLPDQDPLAGFTDVEATTAVGTQVVHDTPVVRAVSDTDIDAIRVTIRIPELWTANQTTGDVTASSLALKIEVQPDGGSYAGAVNETIQGKTTAAYEKAYRIDLAGYGDGPWNVRLTRVSADYDSVAKAGDLYFSSITTIVDHRLIYPDSGLYGVAVDAQTFGGSIPVRSYDIKGREWDVPSNYDPETRTYDGAWDGTFKSAWTDNPAWVFWGLTTHERFGLGEFITTAALDKWSLYAIAQYCDGLVDDGKGGTEPRYTFNGVIGPTRDDALRVLLSLASVFRGMVYWSSGSVFATADMPGDPVKLVTPANVIGGEFTYEGASLKTRHSAVLVTWNDPDDNFNPNIEVVEDADAIEQFGYRPLETAAVGCTSRGQARRCGLWILETERYETELVHYTCSWDQADLRPGQIIAVADPAYAGLRAGGRLLSATLSSLALDNTVNIAALADYSVDVVMPDGSIESRNLTNAVGDTATLTLDEDLPTVPLAGAIWVLTSSAAAPRQFRVISVSETARNLFDVTALFISPGKYSRVESGLIVEDPAYTALPSGKLGAPTNLGHDQSLYESGAGAIFGKVAISWSPSTDPRASRYEVAIARNGLDFARAAITTATSYDVDAIARTETSIGVRVRAMDDLGRFSDWLTVPTIATTMFSAAPDAVTNFRVDVLGDTALATWDPVTSLGVSHYVIRATPVSSDAAWGSAAVLRANVVGANAQLPASNGTFLIKAVSLAGIESTNPTVAVVGGAGLIALNAVESVDPAPDWSGTLDNVAADAGVLKLASGHTEGTYTFADTVDLGEIYTSRVTAAPTVSGSNPSATLSSWGTLSGVTAMSGSDPSQWSISVEERHTSDDPSGSPTWSDWAALTVADIDARAFQFRVKLTSLAGGITPAISALPITIDMPDRIIADADISSGADAGGYDVTFDPAFRGLSEVVINANLGSGEYYFMDPAKKTRSGFNILFKDASGTIVDRTFGFHAAGWGRVAA